MSHLEEFKILSDIQHGFRKHHSCETQLLITLEDLARNLDHGKQSHIILLDFAKAFDTVPHQRLLLKLRHYGIQGTINKWIQAWLCFREQSVLVKGEKSAPVSVMSGVPQGTVLGPLMFLIYINDIGLSIKSCIRLFADDTLFYATVSSKDDANTLQQDLDSLVTWTTSWQMSLNPDKCKTLNVYRSKNPITHQYMMNGVPLDTVSHHRYLGVELSSNLDWSLHIENIIGKANRSLGFIRRNLYSCPESVKSQAYLTLVRPCLEYASSVWDPHTQKHCHDIEGVQRRAARFVKNCYVREPGTVTNLLNDLNWYSLELRRKITRLTTMYKIVNGKIAVNIPEYIVGPTRVTRSYHSSKFINIGSNSNTYKYNFFTRTLKEWNTLPSFLLNQPSVDAFKSAVTKCFSLSI